MTTAKISLALLLVMMCSFSCSATFLRSSETSEQTNCPITRGYQSGTYLCAFNPLDFTWDGRKFTVVLAPGGSLWESHQMSSTDAVWTGWTNIWGNFLGGPVLVQRDPPMIAAIAIDKKSYCMKMDPLKKAWTNWVLCV